MEAYGLSRIRITIHSFSGPFAARNCCLSGQATLRACILTRAAGKEAWSIIAVLSSECDLHCSSSDFLTRSLKVRACIFLIALAR
jgi:hypothetical protein